MIERVHTAQLARNGLGGDAADSEYQSACEAQRKFFEARDAERERARSLGASEKEIKRLGLPAERAQLPAGRRSSRGVATSRNCSAKT